jgi:catechol 2,3-dioxygenase-like lactoylglutathione lyase family enzyme
MDVSDAPVLAGIHHLKLPVTDLARSRDWYHSRLGYQMVAEFVEQEKLMGYSMAHPNGGPPLALRLDRTAPGLPPVSTTSPSACRTGTRSTGSPTG